MTTHDTSVDDTTGLDYDAETEDDWLEEPEQLPPRRRRKLLAPVPLALLAMLLLAGGFLAGVEVQKGEGSSSSSSGFAGFAALRGRGTSSSGSSSTRGSSGGFPGGFAGAGGFGGAGGLAGATTGEVSYISGTTLYVTSGEGNTVKVKAPAGTKVSKTVSTNLNSIHPGDTVVVRGSQSSNGSVTASSITVNASGSSSGGSGGGGSSGSSPAQQLFGAG